jgi:hypothetical protein
MARTKEENTQVQRVRNMARRQGLELMKSRRRDPLALDYGRYVLVLLSANAGPAYVFGSSDGVMSATLDEVEAWLQSGAWTRGRRARVAQPA